MATIIETRDLSKSFKNVDAVSGLSFSILKGDVYGFLGQNGAGKSTTMRMLLGLIYPNSGQIFINGTEFNNSRRYLLQHIGAIIERPDMYGYLSGWKNLEIFAALSRQQIPAARLHAVLEQVGLKGREKDKVKTYSQGMKQRLGIAIALVHEPDLLILDEPTNGLDPQGIADMRELIVSLSREHGKTVLVSSHLLHEIEQVATRMLVIHKGKKIVEGAVKDLLHPDETLVEVVIMKDATIAGKLAGTQWQQHLQASTDTGLTFKLNSKYIPELSKWLVMNGAGIMEIRTKHSLEDYFLSLTNDEVTKHRTV
ncbi:MAG: Phosphonate-transporting ATPase [Flavipsychrobacter sp.]|nr:Phosphonate-transporting ATPase [Flavipsychrobacter sp.]